MSIPASIPASGPAPTPASGPASGPASVPASGPAPADEQVEVRSRRPRRTAGLVGNRYALLGAVLYLCEFVGIALSHAAHLPFIPGTSAHGVAAAYAGHAGGLGFLVGWFGIVQLGRVLFVLAVATALARSGRGSIAAWFAVAAMAVGGAMEIASEALAAGSGELAAAGNGNGAVILDRGASYLAAGILAPTGVAVLALSLVMLFSGRFPRTLSVIGVVAGLGTVAAGLFSEPSQAGTQDSLTTAVLVMWVWMLWTGVLLWRRVPGRSSVAA
jgi:hypothetical protein